MTRLFVYGTLKRGCQNHGWLAGQTFLAEARTAPGFRLFELDGYPGLVPVASDLEGVTGEIWVVDPACLERLDIFEGIPDGSYARTRVNLAAPHGLQPTQAYVYLRSVTGRRDLGSTWRE